MTAAEEATLARNLPTLGSADLDAALHGRTEGRRLFYSHREMEHIQQDHSGNQVGFYASSHNRSANRDGLPGTDDEFPWKHPGGTDGSEVYVFKVMFLPGKEAVSVHRAQLKSFFAGANGGTFLNGGATSMVNGYDWTFPTGTVFFECLSFKDVLRVFEVRTRLKLPDGRWRMNLFRPFVSRTDFDREFEGLIGTSSVQKWRFSDKAIHRNRTAFDEVAFSEEVPGFRTEEERAEAMTRTFESALGQTWSGNDDPAPWTRSKFGIVPQNYSGTFVGNSQASCAKCHADAAVHVRFFDANRSWYGMVRGSVSEKILSFHPIAPSSISRNGGRLPVTLNQKLLEAGIIRKDY
jgi:hypothetical protein